MENVKRSGDADVNLLSDINAHVRLFSRHDRSSLKYVYSVVMPNKKKS